MPNAQISEVFVDGATLQDQRVVNQIGSVYSSCLHAAVVDGAHRQVRKRC